MLCLSTKSMFYLILISMLKSARNISSTETQTQKSFLSAPKQARGLKSGLLGLMMKSEIGLTNKINDNPNWDFAGVYYDAKSGLKSANRKGVIMVRLILFSLNL